MNYQDAIDALRGGRAVPTKHVLSSLGSTSHVAGQKSKGLGTTPDVGPSRLVDLG